LITGRAYSATKAAPRSFLRTWTAELKDRKTRINVISPGGIDTPMFRGVMPTPESAAATVAQIIDMTPLSRIGRPEDVAAAALFLASDESRYIAGIDLPVDGGIRSI